MDTVAVGVELAVDQIKREVRCRMPQVSGVIRRDAADVHPDFTATGRGRGVNLLALLVSGVKKGQRDRSSGDGGDGGRGPRVHGVSLQDSRDYERYTGCITPVASRIITITPSGMR